MTERLYYHDAYTMHFSATVLERLTMNGRPAVVLDRTYFYPSGGGQPFDTGVLNAIQVIEVLPRSEDRAVIHVLNEPLQDDAVTGVVNWSRRFDHMQHHTGQHILTQAFVQVAHANTVSFHLSPDSVTIDLDVTILSQEQLASVEDLANQIIWDNRPVTTAWRQADDQEGVRVRRLPKQSLTGGLRIIDIEGFDVTACGGTHVARTGEIGIIKVLKTERRGNKTRVEFRCGMRALRDFRDKTSVSNLLSASLNCRLSEIPDAINRLKADLKTTQAALKGATNRLLDLEAARLLSKAPQRGHLTIITETYGNRDVGEVKQLAAKLVEQPGVVALLGVAGPQAVLCFARSQNLDNDMGMLLRETLAKFGGRGGGQPEFAQGGGVPLDKETLQSALVSAQTALLAE
jgi:alanyl-tRNA synthetase